jgi:hypothetical protein
MLPLSPAMRRLLLELLSLGYAPGDAQANLAAAPDAAVAWQVQSMLDDFADYQALLIANDDLIPANDNLDLDEAA